ncbi:hypothetical protein ACQ4LE_006889 [Meloidogyne hapla]|uniref:FLYWCH-type domain-containing protein n=1 Tax=Meloidogyne hapla TaxID=6305 RepID=A0A1I8BVD5_MELHA
MESHESPETKPNKRNFSKKLPHEGFNYIVERVNLEGQKKYWRCEHYHRKGAKCAGRLHTNMEDEILTVIGEHTCNQFVEEEPVQVKPNKAIKRRAAEDSFRTPYQQQMFETENILLSKRGRPKFHHNGFLYCFEKMNSDGDVRFWKCEFFNSKHVKCRARLHTDLEHNVVREMGVHICPSDEENVELQRMISEIKRRALETSEPASVLREYTIQSSPAELVSLLPSKDAMRKIVQRVRKERPPSMAGKFEQVFVRQEVKDERFVPEDVEEHDYEQPKFPRRIIRKHDIYNVGSTSAEEFESAMSASTLNAEADAFGAQVADFLRNLSPSCMYRMKIKFERLMQSSMPRIEETDGKY